MYSRQQILNMLKKAENNPQLKKKLVDEAVRQANIVNARMYRLEKEGFGDVFGTTAKVKEFALEHYGKETLSKSKTALRFDDELLKEQLLLTSKFLRARTTIIGAAERAKGVAQVLRLDVEEGQERDVLRFLESDMFNELRRLGSARVIQDAVEAIKQGASIEDLNKSYQNYLNKQTTLLESFESWAQIK